MKANCDLTQALRARDAIEELLLYAYPLSYGKMQLLLAVYELVAELVELTYRLDG